MHGKPCTYTNLEFTITIYHTHYKPFAFLPLPTCYIPCLSALSTCLSDLNNANEQKIDSTVQYAKNVDSENVLCARKFCNREHATFSPDAYIHLKHKMICLLKK